MYQDQLNAKLQAQALYDNQAESQGAMCAQAGTIRPSTLAEEAQRNEQFHYEKGAKAGEAARFLSSHPEFDEFIRLVRAGALQF